MRILGVSGSLRESSFNTSLLRAAVEAAPDGVELELWEGLAELPLYDEELDGDDAPAAVRRLREAWGEADAILFATPEYNGSVPGGLKNAIDWASRPRGEAALRNKTVAVVGASTGQFGAMWAQQDLKRILGIAGARVVGTEIPVGRAQERFDNGAASNIEVRDAQLKLTSAELTLVSTRIDVQLAALDLQAAIGKL